MTTQEPKVDEAPLKIAVLPYEILVCQIVESLDDSSEACLLRTCRFFRNLVEPVLYRHIRVQHGPEEHNSSPLKPHLLHRTLVGRPDLLPAILSYHGPLIPNPRPSFPPERKEALWRKLMTTARQPAATSSVITEYLERATTIFSGTINMRELHFTDRLPLSIRAVLSVLDAPQLKMVNIKRLVLDTEWCWSRLPSVLRKQPGLKHLELPHMIRGGELELDETDFPELESLRAELRHAARIVPGRPVRKLDLQYTWRPNEDALWQRLTLSTCGITEVVIPSTFSWNAGFARKCFQSLARYLPGVEHLCCQLPRAMPDRIVHPFTPCTASDSTLLESLPAFTSLSHLKLVGCLCATVPGDDQQQTTYTRANFGSFVQRVKEHCPSLVEVEWGPDPTQSCCTWEDESPIRYRVTQ